MKPRAFLAAVGDVNDPVTWSGIPYHFLQSARIAGLLDEGLPLSTGDFGWKALRLGWNLSRVLSGDRYGGYQYSTAFLERLWSTVLPRLKSNLVVNCFQLYAPIVVRDHTIEKWFFIDQTLLQLFDYYEQRATVGRRIALEAIEREREGYNAAAGVIVHSRWAAESVMRDYLISPDRVHVVLPGANVDQDEYARWEIEEERRRATLSDEERPLRLVFVGKYWHRKGLDRLLHAIALARRDGLRATLRVIGCERDSLPDGLRDVEGVEWLGFIDKRTQAVRFFRAVSECDVGCLLSRVEAGGIALREYHALGLISLGADTGGAPEHMIAGASVTVPTGANDEEIANTLLNLERDPSRLNNLRMAAWEKRRSALWDESVRQILSFWPHARTGSEAPFNLTADFSPQYDEVRC
ncbi:MAG TPA: glycosyltransferase family 4 protein [Pyrinomonadaceae bacterium]